MPGKESWGGLSAFLTPSFSRFFPLLPSRFTFALSRNGVTFATAMPRLSNRVKEDPVQGGLEMARVAASTELQGVLTYGQPRAASSSRLNHPRSFVRTLPPPPSAPRCLAQTESINRVRTFYPSIQDVTYRIFVSLFHPSPLSRRKRGGGKGYNVRDNPRGRHLGGHPNGTEKVSALIRYADTHACKRERRNTRASSQRFLETGLGESNELLPRRTFQRLQLTLRDWASG